MSIDASPAEADLDALDIALLLLEGLEVPATLTPEERHTLKARLRLIRDRAEERLLQL